MLYLHYTNRLRSCREEEAEVGLPCTMICVRSRSAEGKPAMLSARTRRCLLMCPPRAWPVEKPSPHMAHAWTSTAFGDDRGCFLVIAGRLRWLVRWPPSAWNVGNSRPHVRQSNDDDDACCFPRRRRRRPRSTHGGGECAGGVPAAGAASEEQQDEDEPHDRVRKTSSPSKHDGPWRWLIRRSMTRRACFLC